jgi:hypothetical protein
MILRQLIGGSAAAIVGAGTILASVTVAQAAMLPVPHYATPSVHQIDCAVGAHLGPLGACIVGNDDNRAPAVVEHRSADVPDHHDAGGCATKSVNRTDDTGNSETKTKTNC